MRVIGLDIGEVRTGVAVSDPDARVANPITVLDTKRLLADPRPLRELVEEGDARAARRRAAADDGGRGGAAGRARVRELGDRLGELLGVPVVVRGRAACPRRRPSAC